MEVEHILDTKVLKSWGFVLGAPDWMGQPMYIKRVEENDIHGYGAYIQLQLMPNPTLGFIWWLNVAEGEQLFMGVIESSEALECILKATLYFKPTKKELKENSLVKKSTKEYQL